MSIKVLNVNYEILKTWLNPKDHFNITLTVEMCVCLNQSSSFIYSHMNEAIEKQVASAEYIQAAAIFPH